MAVWPWVQGSSLIDVDVAAFPAVNRWSETILQRPAVIRAISGEKTAVPDHYMQKRAKLTPEQWSNTFGDKMHGAATLK
jgi:hypothetical protein